MENHSKTTQLICISHPCVGEWYFEVEKKNEHFFSISKKQCGKGGFEYIQKIETYNKDHNEILCVATVTFTDGSTGSYYVKPKIYKTRYIYKSLRIFNMSRIFKIWLISKKISVDLTMGYIPELIPKRRQNIIEYYI